MKFLKNIFDYLNLKFSDKWLHFWAGFIIAVLFVFIELAIVKWQGFATSLFLIPAFSLPFGALVIVALIGAWKEVWFDGHCGYGTSSWIDFWWTIRGGLVGAVLFWIVILTFKLVPSDGQLITPAVEFKQRIEDVHKNDPASFSDSTLIKRSEDLKNK